MSDNPETEEPLKVSITVGGAVFSASSATIVYGDITIVVNSGGVIINGNTVINGNLSVSGDIS